MGIILENGPRLDLNKFTILIVILSFLGNVIDLRTAENQCRFNLQASEGYMGWQ